MTGKQVMFPTQEIDFVGKELKQEKGVLELWIKFQCSPLLCDNQELGM